MDVEMNKWLNTQKDKREKAMYDQKQWRMQYYILIISRMHHNHEVRKNHKTNLAHPAAGS